MKENIIQGLVLGVVLYSFCPLWCESSFCFAHSTFTWDTTNFYIF